MLLDRTKIPSWVDTHEKLISWSGACLNFNMSGTASTLTFIRAATDPEPTRLVDSGIFRDAAGVVRYATIAYPPIDPAWEGTAAKPPSLVLPLSLSAQAAIFDS
jgi:hypothetical protein